MRSKDIDVEGDRCLKEQSTGGDEIDGSLAKRRMLVFLKNYCEIGE